MLQAAILLAAAITVAANPLNLRECDGINCTQPGFACFVLKSGDGGGRCRLSSPCYSDDDCSGAFRPLVCDQEDHTCKKTVTQPCSVTAECEPSDICAMRSGVRQCLFPTRHKCTKDEECPDGHTCPWNWFAPSWVCQQPAKTAQGHLQVAAGAGSAAQRGKGARQFPGSSGVGGSRMHWAALAATAAAVVTLERAGAGI